MYVNLLTRRDEIHIRENVTFVPAWKLKEHLYIIRKNKNNLHTKGNEMKLNLLKQDSWMGTLEHWREVVLIEFCKTLIGLCLLLYKIFTFASNYLCANQITLRNKLNFSRVAGNEIDFTTDSLVRYSSDIIIMKVIHQYTISKVIIGIMLFFFPYRICDGQSFLNLYLVAYRGTHVTILLNIYIPSPWLLDIF